MATGYYEASILLFANARGAGTLLIAKCPALVTHCSSNAWGLPGGGGGSVLVGTDSHITRKEELELQNIVKDV